MKLDLKTLGYIKIFEGYTHVPVKDCFFSGKTLVFIVNPGFIGKAIGKKGNNVRILSKKYKKPLKVIEYNDDVVKFVSNIIYPLKVHIEKKDDKVIISCEDNKTKGFLFGREKSKLKEMQDMVKRYFKAEIVIE